MSYAKLIGVGDEVSGEAIVNGMNAQGLACTGMTKSMEGEKKVITFELAEGEAAAYRNAQTRTDLLTKFADALKRAGVYITGASPRISPKAAKGNLSMGVKERITFEYDPTAEFRGTGSLIAQATPTEPPPSSPPYGSLEWAKQILPDEV